MSATGRNTPEHKRDARDFYATPAWCAAQGAQVLARYVRGARAVDPGAGRGALVRAARAEGFPAWGIELDPALAAEGAAAGVHAGDAFACNFPPDLAFLLNPPYREAERFIRLCMSARPVACVALLRLGFLASKRRRGFWSDFSADVYVSAKRPSFAHGGTTDSADYGWFSFRAKDARGDTLARLEAPDLVAGA